MKTSFFNFNRKVFSTTLSSLFKYSDPSNPKVFFKLSKNNTELGNLVFELYKNKCPITVKNFMLYCNPQNSNQVSYKNSVIDRITKGYCLQAGNLENVNKYNNYSDENLNLKHTKRGVITMDNQGPDTNLTRFMVTFTETPWLDGYHNVIGELVEGDNVLTEVENSGTREGTPNAEIRIVDCGHLV